MGGKRSIEALKQMEQYGCGLENGQKNDTFHPFKNPKQLANR